MTLIYKTYIIKFILSLIYITLKRIITTVLLGKNNYFKH